MEPPWQPFIRTLPGLVLLIAMASTVSCRREAAPSGPAPIAATPQPAPPEHPPVALEKTLADQLIEKLEGRRAPESPAILLARLRDATAPERVRSAAAMDLARIGSAEAMAALDAILNDVSASSTLKADIAEALGECPNPDARALLLKLVESRDETVARGAVRGLGARDDSAAFETLSSLLRDDRRSTGLRSEAALALGASGNPGAFSALQAALAGAIDQPAFARDILEGIGRRPFEETQFFYTALLQEKDVPAHVRVSALESLADPEGDANSLLLAYSKDPNPQARAAAAWALTGAENRSGLSEPLVNLLQNEPESQVRLRLYQALARQPEFDQAAVQRLVTEEQDIATKLAGYSALARATTTPEGARYFDEHAVPELERTASSGVTLHQRLASVVALQSARTPGARAALAGLAQTSQDAQVAQAAQSAMNRAVRRP